MSEAYRIFNIPFSSFAPDIEEVEYERRTEKSIWVNGQRHPIRSRAEIFFFSREDAVQSIRENLESNIEAIERRLRDAKKALAEFQKKNKEAPHDG